MRICLLLVALCLAGGFSRAQEAELVRIATGLRNPRGIAVLPDGRLLVAQAGAGKSGALGGALSLLTDWNGDGDYDDAAEVIDIQEDLPSYNILNQSNPGRDEVIGIGDVLALDDGRVFYTLDDNFKLLAIVALDRHFERVGSLRVSDGSMNGIAFDPASETIYIAESTENAIGAVTLDGDYRKIAGFEPLAQGQQAVPAGLAIDPTSGELLVALFSGQLWVYHGGGLSYMPGAAKIARVNPGNGGVRDEITGLTTAVDVAVDERGNIYALELTTLWPTPMVDQSFDLFDRDGAPDPGGYPRFSGRLTRFAPDGARTILAEGLDQPTNLTCHGGRLYISTGQGTPGRRIWSERGITRVTGEIYTLALDA